MNCPVCNNPYTEGNWKTHHHILPRRYFNGNGEKFELCRNCHNKLEMLIPFAPQLTEWEYYRILLNFLAKHSSRRFKKRYQKVA